MLLSLTFKKKYSIVLTMSVKEKYLPSKYFIVIRSQRRMRQIYLNILFKLLSF